jgi:hypothetical protein
LSRSTCIVSVEDVFCARVAERPYHGTIITWKSCYCKGGIEETSVLRAQRLGNHDPRTRLHRDSANHPAWPNGQVQPPPSYEKTLTTARLGGRLEPRVGPWQLPLPAGAEDCHDWEKCSPPPPNGPGFSRRRVDETHRFVGKTLSNRHAPAVGLQPDVRHRLLPHPAPPAN